MRIIFFIFILFVSKTHSQTSKWNIEAFGQLNRVNFFKQNDQVINPQNLVFVNNLTDELRPSIGIAINKNINKTFQHSFRFNSIKVGGTYFFSMINYSPNFPFVGPLQVVGIELAVHQFSYTMRTNVINLFEKYIANQNIDVRNYKRRVASRVDSR